MAEALRAKFPDADEDDLTAMANSSWGAMAQTTSFHNQQSKRITPTETTR